MFCAIEQLVTLGQSRRRSDPWEIANDLDRWRLLTSMGRSLATASTAVSFVPFISSLEGDDGRPVCLNQGFGSRKDSQPIDNAIYLKVL